ncbi:hypothetical protein NDU88_001233 [Pleurodeles waltl]|uniref:Uncharacterized protein n=1 Tax=Pleurodeles waltl TaxID=8319 RepID=A0AAV7V7A4_PLEWA|nr:hypothetical protein NDU88_001233 [Pleurodeles waltl]
MSDTLALSERNRQGDTAASKEVMKRRRHGTPSAGMTEVQDVRLETSEALTLSVPVSGGHTVRCRPGPGRMRLAA